MTKFIVKAMLPISIVEAESFRELIRYLEPGFGIPSRHTMREANLPALKEIVEKKIRNDLALMESINISLDGWSDKIMRCFNGFIAQGIH